MYSRDECSNFDDEYDSKYLAIRWTFFHTCVTFFICFTPREIESRIEEGKNQIISFSTHEKAINTCTCKIVSARIQSYFHLPAIKRSCFDVKTCNNQNFTSLWEIAIKIFFIWNMIRWWFFIVKQRKGKIICCFRKWHAKLGFKHCEACKPIIFDITLKITTN